MDPGHLRESLTGLLSFPVTPFTADGELDLPRFREHVAHQVATDARALFVACGTGEFFSLSMVEHEAVVRAAVEEVGGEKPVLAGVGYGYGLAAQTATAAEAAGADGLLVLPPYLVKGDQDGLYAHYRRVAEATRLGVIVYQRDNAVFSATTARRLAELPNVVGLKDALGDTDHLTRIRLACEDRLALMNGMPTAEMTAAAYAACGVTSYSSAVLNFVPGIAHAFYAAVRGGDTAVTERLLDGFFTPLVELRDEREGYAVALIKAGVTLRERPVGDPRPPLIAPGPDHVERLARIVDQGLDLLPSSHPEPAPAQEPR